MKQGSQVTFELTPLLPIFGLCSSDNDWMSMPNKLGYLPLLRFSVQVFSLLDYSCVPEKHQHISRGLSPDPVMVVTGTFYYGRLHRTVSLARRRLER